MCLHFFENLPRQNYFPMKRLEKFGYNNKLA
jgi:hypothetical protein